jgi:uncharacterized protein DUF4442
MINASPDFLRLMRNPIKFRLFLLGKLPSAYFAGVRVRSVDGAQCVTTVPYKWFSQNPFRSTYFACLAMAAEMSTGVLAMAYTYKSRPPVSMLVVKMEVHYEKKAVGRTVFSCEDGHVFQSAISNAIATGEPETVEATSIGKNEQGEVIARFRITWSFKAKNNRQQP